MSEHTAASPSRLTYANVMSTIAVFFSLAGASWAATALPRNSVGTSQIKRDAVTGVKVKDGSLDAADFRAGSLPAGANGAAGAKGDPGAKGDTGAKGDSGAKGDPGDTGASGSPDTAGQVLAKLLTVDGAGSGLDADLVDGIDAASLVSTSTAAGGALSGTYPSPAIASDAVDGMTIEDGSVSGADLAGNTLTGTQINESTLAGVLKGNGVRTHDYRALSAGSGNQTVVSVAGLGSLAVNCTGGAGAQGLDLTWTNPSVLNSHDLVATVVTAPSDVALTGVAVAPNSQSVISLPQASTATLARSVTMTVHDRGDAGHPGVTIIVTALTRRLSADGCTVATDAFAT